MNELEPDSTSALDRLLANQKILIFVGSGGVGKTTGSAATAIRSAHLGYRTLVITVDPARRLANSLGMADMPKSPVKLALPDSIQGSLSALMFDAKTTFDEVVKNNAPDPTTATSILNNKFYQKAATSLAGAHEYMAMERLLMLHESDGYDRIILDTPPSIHALDFLEAPDKLLQFLEHATTRIVMKARRATRRRSTFLRPRGLIARGVSRFVGGDFFVDLLEFIQSFEAMYPGFRDRASRVKEILRSKQTGIVVVHAPEEATLREAAHFDERLNARGHRVVGFVANRVHLRAQFDAHSAREMLAEQMLTHPAVERFGQRSRKTLLKKLNALDSNMTFLSDQDHESLGRIRARAAQHDPPVPLFLIPHFQEDIHDLTGLAKFAQMASIAAPE